jgi:heme exporter protein A
VPALNPTAPDMAAMALAAEDVACRRGPRLVFAGISFRLPPGGALLLTGANGSGKSSLLRLAAGLLTPAAGRLSWGGVLLAADLAAHHARLHHVGHQDAAKPTMTPRETLAFWAALRGRRRGTATAIEDALAAFALDPVADWPCRWLSAGQRRRLALSRLLVAPAPLWLLDEPTSALDADGQGRLEDIIRQHRATGGHVMLATHAPVALDGAQTLVLDDFAPRFDPALIL